MITNLIIVDTELDDAILNILKVLKKSDSKILQFDLVNSTVESLHNEIQSTVLTMMDQTSVNLTNILFCEFNILNNNIKNNRFLGTHSKLYNINTQDANLDSWEKYNELFLSLRKGIELQTIDFLDINHVLYSDSYEHPLQMIEDKLRSEPVFNVQVGNISKLCSQSEKEQLQQSTNWLLTLFADTCVSNEDVSTFVTRYFVNNTSLRDQIDVVGGDKFDATANKLINVVPSENAKLNDSINVLMIPLDKYENNESALQTLATDLMETIDLKTHIQFIYQQDDDDAIHSTLSNIISTHMNHLKQMNNELNNNLSLTCPLNLWIHTPHDYNLDNEQLTISTNTEAITKDSDAFLESLIHNSIQNSDVNSVCMHLDNIPRDMSQSLSSCLLSCSEKFKEQGVVISLEELSIKFSGLYYPSKIESSDIVSDYVSYKTNYEDGKETKCSGHSQLLNHIDDLSIEIFTEPSHLNHLILYDLKEVEHIDSVFESILADSGILTFDANIATYEQLKTKISALCVDEFVELSTVALFQEYARSEKFSFLKEETSHLLDVGGCDNSDFVCKDISEIDALKANHTPLTSNDDVPEYTEPTPVYLTPEEITEMIEAGEEPPSLTNNEPETVSVEPEYEWFEDPQTGLSYVFTDLSLNSWAKFIDFAAYLKNTIGISHMDLLMCSLSSRDWDYVIGEINRQTNLSIRSSEDDTGHRMFDADWILETPHNTDLVGLYFNVNIYDVEIVLGTGYVFSSNNTLKQGTQRHIMYYSSWVATYGEIETWDVANVTSFDKIFYNYSSTYNLNYDLNSWNTSNVTTLNQMFNLSYYVNCQIDQWDTSKVWNMTSTFSDTQIFGSDISSWNVSNVTHMASTFYLARGFNSDISQWDVANVVYFNNAFRYAFSFNQNLNSWDLGSATNMSYMFDYAKGFAQALTGDWATLPSTVNVTGMMTNTPAYIATTYDNNVGFQSKTELSTAVTLWCSNKGFAKTIYGDIKDWNTGNVTDMSSLFMNKTGFCDDLSNWDTGNVTTMASMFQSCTAFNADIENWNVSKVTNMSNMFYAAGAFSGDLGNWDTGNVTNMSWMFRGCKIFNGKIGNWNVSKVTNMSHMFMTPDGQFNQPIDNWDVGNVTDFSAFLKHNKFFNQSLDSWIVSDRNINMTDMFRDVPFKDCNISRVFRGDWMNIATSSYTISTSNMFRSSFGSISTTGDDWDYVPQYNVTPQSGYEYLYNHTLPNAINAWIANKASANTTYGHISQWDVGNVTTFHRLFYNKCQNVNFTEDLSNWNTSNVTIMTETFRNCYNFLGDISGWDTGNVTTMVNMCNNARGFNSEISNWDTSNVTDMYGAFYTAYAFNQDLNWNVSKVTRMNMLFQQCGSFRGDVSNWDVGNVTSLNATFFYCYSFNSDISGWQPANNTNCANMMRETYGFDSDLSPWDSYISNVVSFNGAFRNAKGMTSYLAWSNISSTADVTNMFYQANIGLAPGSSGFTSKNSLRDAIAAYITQPAYYKTIYGDISGWNVSQITDMSSLFSGLGSDIQFFNYNIENWDVGNVTNMAGMFLYVHNTTTPTSNVGLVYFNQPLNSWNVSNVTDFSNMFYGCTRFNKNISSWAVSEQVADFTNMFYDALSFDIELTGYWTIIHDDSTVTDMFGGTSAGSISPIAFNAPRISFTSDDVSNNGTLTTDEIYIDVILTSAVTGGLTASDISASGGTIDRFYAKNTLNYNFRYTATTFGQASQFSIITSTKIPASDYILDTFAWTWSPTQSQLTFVSSDVSANSTLSSSTIAMELQLSNALIFDQVIEKEDLTITNGAVTQFVRSNPTKYTFTFVSLSPNSQSTISLPTSVDLSNAVHPTDFDWTWTATIAQPTFALSSVDVSHNATIKKTEIDMLLTYTPNNNIQLPTLTVSDVSFTNGEIRNFSKISRTQYAFKFKSYSRDVYSSVSIPAGAFNFNYIDGASNLETAYEGLGAFNWKYNGLDITPVNNKTIGVVDSNRDSSTLELVINGDVSYTPIYNEYEFNGNTANYLSISGEIFDGTGEATVSFWYKTNSTSTAWETLMTLKDNQYGQATNNNLTISKYFGNDVFYMKKTGASAQNTISSSLPYYSTSYSHMVITFTSTSTVIYKNGVLQQTITDTNSIPSGERVHQYIGVGVSDAGVINRAFSGFIKNIRFYNFAITSSDVSSLYTMYNTGMNDTVPQIQSITLTSTDVSHNGQYDKAVVNMEMEVAYDTTASISSIDTQSFIINRNNFDTSFGYVYDFQQLSDTKVGFKFGANTTINNSQLFVKTDSVTRRVNSVMDVTSNPTSNVFVWKYASAPLTVTSILSNVGSAGANTNSDVIWVQVVFSEEVFNFRKKFVAGTNCKVVKVTGSGTKYAIKLQTFKPTSASIAIDTSTIITTGKGLQKYITAGSNTSYNWNYDNVVQTITLTADQDDNLTNNASYVDVSFTTSRTTTDFTSASLNITGSASITNFTGSGQNYSARIVPFGTGDIVLQAPSSAFTDVYGNTNTTAVSFNWTYVNTLPEVEIVSTAFNSGTTSDLENIPLYFITNKPVVDFGLADISVSNGNLSNFTTSTTFPNHVTNHTVTVSSKTANNSYYSNGSSSAFFIGGTEAPVVSFVDNETYTFDQSDATNSGHPLLFYEDAEKTVAYTTGVTATGTPGSSGANTQIAVTSSTPATLYYQCSNHSYMGGVTARAESYTATLVPSGNNVTVGVTVEANKVKDSVNNFNASDSNTFEWNYNGVDFLVSIDSTTITPGQSYLYDTIQMRISLGYTTTAPITSSVFTVQNGTISNFSQVDSKNYTFSLQSSSYSADTSVFVAQGTISNTIGVTNVESNKFIWRYSPPIPTLAISSTGLTSGGITNDSSVDLQLDFTENVTIDINDITITNASGSLSGSNNSYVLTVTPDVIVDSSAEIDVDISEDTGFYNRFNGTDFYNDVSYGFSWTYDSIIPTATISSTIATQDVSTNIQTVPLSVTFNKNMSGLNLTDFTVSTNAALSSLTGSGTTYSMFISALDNTIDNQVTIQIASSAITDEAGNNNSATNEFRFTINAKVSRALESSAIESLFTQDTDIPSDEQLSTEEIDMVLAVEIPDATVPDFDNLDAPVEEVSEPTVPLIALPPAVSITNRKVFTRLIDQIFEKAEDVTSVKLSKDDVAVSATAADKIQDVEEVVMAKSNQVDPPVVLETGTTDSALFVPLANVGDLVVVSINSVSYLTVVNSDNTFGLTVDGVSVGNYSTDDIYTIDSATSIIFGSQIVSSTPPPPSPPTVTITSSDVADGATTDSSHVELTLTFSTTVEFVQQNITTSSNSTIDAYSIGSANDSSFVSVTIRPTFVDVSGDITMTINEQEFYSTVNSVDYYNDVSYTYSWSYDATTYNSSTEVQEETENVFIDPVTGFIECFLEGTTIQTTTGNKNVEELKPGKDKLVTHDNKTIDCLNIKKYVQKNDGEHFPYRIPKGSQLSENHICTNDLYLTHNHCVFLPEKNIYAPVSQLKNIQPCYSTDKEFVYYHVFTENYFSDTIVANGIPCETHSKYAFERIQSIDPSLKLLKDIFTKTKIKPNGQRHRIGHKEYSNILRKHKRKTNNKKRRAKK